MMNMNVRNRKIATVYVHKKGFKSLSGHCFRQKRFPSSFKGGKNTLEKYTTLSAKFDVHPKDILIIDWWKKKQSKMMNINVKNRKIATVYVHKKGFKSLIRENLCTQILGNFANL